MIGSRETNSTEQTQIFVMKIPHKTEHLPAVFSITSRLGCVKKISRKTENSNTNQQSPALSRLRFVMKINQTLIAQTIVPSYKQATQNGDSGKVHLKTPPTPTPLTPSLHPYPPKDK